MGNEIYEDSDQDREDANGAATFIVLGCLCVAVILVTVGICLFFAI